jgi:hypothetical protein
VQSASAPAVVRGARSEEVHAAAPFGRGGVVADVRVILQGRSRARGVGAARCGAVLIDRSWRSVLAAGAQSRASINLILAPYRTSPRNAGTNRQHEFGDRSRMTPGSWDTCSRNRRLESP